MVRADKKSREIKLISFSRFFCNFLTFSLSNLKVRTASLGYLAVGLE